MCAYDFPGAGRDWDQGQGPHADLLGLRPGLWRLSWRCTVSWSRSKPCKCQYLTSNIILSHLCLCNSLGTDWVPWSLLEFMFSNFLLVSCFPGFLAHLTYTFPVQLGKHKSIWDLNWHCIPWFELSSSEHWQHFSNQCSIYPTSTCIICQ